MARYTQVLNSKTIIWKQMMSFLHSAAAVFLLIVASYNKPGPNWFDILVCFN